MDYELGVTGPILSNTSNLVELSTIYIKYSFPCIRALCVMLLP